MSPHSSWTSAKNAILDLIFPPHCVACGHSGEWLCHDCIASFNPVKPPVCAMCGRPLPRGGLCDRCLCRPLEINSIRAVAYFEGAVRQAIHHFKYNGTRVLAHCLGEVMAQAWHRAPLPVSAIVPVPLHPQRARQRGYNQSALLARELGQRVSLPVIEDCLLRVRPTRPQVGLGAAERRLNVQDAFECADRRLAGTDLVLIDDVCTTGATLEACAHTLHRQGSRAVWALVLARDHSR